MLPSGRPAIQTKSVTVPEWGYKIPWTNFEAQLTHYELPDQFEQSLREQMSLAQDKMVADASKLTPIKYIPKLAGSVIRTDGTTGGNVADKNLDISDLRAIHDYMRQTLKTPYFRNGRYVGIMTTRASRGIKNDPLYESWQAPTTSDPFLTGSLKDVEGFMLLESNHVGSLLDLVGTSVTTGEAVFFGADAVGMLMIQEPEIRMSLPLANDLGRFREVGWVAIMEAFLTWEVAATARVMHVTSA
jgi:hypothetical protein